MLHASHCDSPQHMILGDCKESVELMVTSYRPTRAPPVVLGGLTESVNANEYLLSIYHGDLVSHDDFSNHSASSH